MSPLLPYETYIAKARLQVHSIPKARTFYSGLLGMSVLPGSDAHNVLILGADVNGPPLIELRGEKSARPRPARTTGLFHLALRFPDRAAFGRTLRNLIQHTWPLKGAANHGVSEAVYLNDPEGNAIKLYVDSPADQWPRLDGQLNMDSQPLDLLPLIKEAGSDASGRIDPGVRVGHIHLNVTDLASSEKFYHSLVGFDITQRTDTGAIFLSAGGYHHHLGLNIWNGRGALPPPSKSIGVTAFTIAIPDPGALENLRCRLLDCRMELKAEPGGFSVIDPSAIRVVFTS